jgi:transposase
MFSLTSQLRFHVYARPTDMRKSIDGLCGIVRGSLRKDPVSSEDVYVFTNKQRNKVKLLHWESGGFVLYYKRLESGTLDWPFSGSDTLAQQLSYTRLLLLLEGVTIKTFLQRKRYKKPSETLV